MYKQIGISILTLFFISACSPTGNAAQPEPVAQAAPAETAEVADTVYVNGKIYTVSESQPWVEAVAIKDGRFIAVGSADEIAVMTGDATEVVDLKGRFGSFEMVRS